MPNDYLGEFEHLVLLAIARSGGKAGGADVHAELEAVSRRDPSMATIYVTLARLQKKRFIREAGEVPREEGGRPRRLYEITRAGAHAMRTTRDVLERLWMDTPQLGRGRR